MSNPEADRNPDIITGFIIGSNPYSLLLREPALKGSSTHLQIRLRTDRSVSDVQGQAGPWTFLDGSQPFPDMSGP